jgi:hypothetical protein
VHPDYTEAALRIIERQPFVDSAHWYERGAKTRIFIEWSKLYDESDVAGLREKLEKLVASNIILGIPALVRAVKERTDGG